MTSPLQARAVTIGQDVYFHPGQYRPGMPDGDQLINHELAHTLQTKAGAGSTDVHQAHVSQPGDALEENANALASGETRHADHAPPGAKLRSPFDQESPADHARRTVLLQSIQHAESNLLRLLSTGGLVAVVETTRTDAGSRGVWVNPHQRFLSFSDRDVMIRRIIRTLMAMSTQYLTTPIAADLPSATQDEDNSFSTHISYTGGGSTFSGDSAPWAQLQAAYELYRRSQGDTGDEFEMDWYYLSPSVVVNPGAARGAPRIGRGIGSGAYVVFPDLVNEPRNYRLLNGFDPVPRGSPIIELWHDDFGYYYMQDERRIDVDSPWSTDHPRH